MQSSKDNGRRMQNFPQFVKNSCNKVKVDDIVEGIEGYLFEGIDGIQIVLWESKEGGRSEMHTHDYDEYVVVIQGYCEYTVGEEHFTLGPGDEYCAPGGVPHGGMYTANYRSIDIFGCKRFERMNKE